MKKRFLDYRLLLGFLIAHALIYFSFHERAIFWYIFTGSLLMLIAYAMYHGDVDDELSFIRYLSLGILAGLLLYLLFWVGFHVIEILHIPHDKTIKKLYKWYSPNALWHYIALVLVAAPGEELFWRGFIQKRLLTYMKPLWSILVAALLYASVNLYSESFLLVFSSLVSGVFWGILYYWKKSMPLVIVSHIIFDLMIFAILPFK